LGKKQNYPTVNAMQNAVLTTDGASPTDLRQHIIDYACNPDNTAIDTLPETVQTYIDKVVRHAYRVTDKDVQVMKDAGHSEEFIFEITVTAALGASLRRFHKALDVLESINAD
jgi:hypothetical protein